MHQMFVGVVKMERNFKFKFCSPVIRGVNICAIMTHVDK